MVLAFQYGFQIFFSLTQLVHFSALDQKDHRHTLEELVQVTIELVRNHVQESAWLVSTAAQRVIVDANVKSCCVGSPSLLMSRCF